MNNKELAQAFAQGADKGRGNNLYIEGTTVYSYGPHFPIATWTQDPATGAPVVAFTTNKYSVTTSKHKSCVRMALIVESVKIVESDVRTQDGRAVSLPGGLVPPEFLQEKVSVRGTR